MRVLVADDEDPIIDLLSRGLNENGCVVDRVATRRLRRLDSPYMIPYICEEDQPLSGRR